MGRLARILALLAAIPPPTAAQPPSAEDPATLRIVVHAENPVPRVSASELKRIFLKSTSTWPRWGYLNQEVPVEAVDQLLKAPARQTFSKVVFRKSAATIDTHWQRTIFAGYGSPPSKLGSDGDVLDYVRVHRCAIGYVSASTPLGDGVRSLLISDIATAVEDLQVIAESGDVRIRLTGWCGSRAEGRVAVLYRKQADEKSQAKDKVKVTTETATFLEGTMESTRSRTYELGGGEAVFLGCTRSEAAVLRYSLAGSTNDSKAAAPAPPLDAPPGLRQAEEVDCAG